MLTRSSLLEKVRRALQQRNIDYLDFSLVPEVVFDLIIKLERPLVLKVLKNIECLKRSSGELLKKVAESLDARPLIIAEYEKQKKIPDNSVGCRFGVHFINCKTFEKLLDNEYPCYYYSRGGLYVRVRILNSQQAREKLRSEGLSRKRVAEIASSCEVSVTLRIFKVLEDCVEPIRINLLEKNSGSGGQVVYRVERSPHDLSVLEESKLVLLGKCRQRLEKEFRQLADFLNVEPVFIDSEQDISEVLRRRLRSQIL
ncbi:MAG: hypothetical protein GXO42_00045 [bacterium]|nr:hypothetical protein [bacterium]